MTEARRPIKVVVVDDSAVVRKIVADVLTSDPEVEVVGRAANGRIGLAQVKRLRPDVVTLDVAMPEVDGMAALAVLNRDFPQVRVLMLSAITERGAVATLDALAGGASDYVTKPARSGSLAASEEHLRAELLPRVKALGRPAAAPSPRAARRRAQRKRPKRLPSGATRVVTLGCSTGGPQALRQVVPTLPANFALPLLIVQHMPPVFTEHLARRLDEAAQLSVAEGRGGARVRAGEAWIAPGGLHMGVAPAGAAVELEVHDGAPVQSCRPAADVLFSSAQEVYGGGVIGVVLTGLGQDGLAGCRAIREGGGVVVAQDPREAVAPSMPRAVIQAGLADHVVSLAELAPCLLELAPLRIARSRR